MKRWIGQWLVITLLLGSTPWAWADSQADVMDMLQSMKQQMAQMQETINQQNLRIQELESRKAAETTPARTSTSTTQASLTDSDWQKGIKENIGEAVPFLKGAKYAGDLRLRYEAFNFYDRNDDNGSTTTASDRDRNRFRIRLRWGFEKDYGDDWKVGFRLATGSTTDQVSTNQTLGNSGYFNFKSVNIDRAHAVYSPGAFKDYGLVKGVSIGAGKFENPFARYGTTIVWDSDVTPEGAYEKAVFEFLKTDENQLRFETTLGQFLVNENAGNNTDAELYGYQGALHWSTSAFHTEKPVEMATAVSFYDYNNWSTTVTSNSSGVSYLRTNTLAADNFRVVDFYPEIQFQAHHTPMTLWYNYVKNVGNEGTENARGLTNPIHDDDTAWGVGIKVGKAKKKGELEGFYGYYEIEANSVVAAFNDGDFGGPGTVGATNRKGHKFGLVYKLTDSVDVSWTGFVVSPADPSSIVANSTNETVFRSQLDFNYKF